MRIAQINFIRVNNALGGTERVYINMANEMVRRGHDVACFYFDKQQGAPIFHVDERVYIKNCYGALIIRVKKAIAQIRSCFIVVSVQISNVSSFWV